jgi:hypothetical protein
MKGQPTLDGISRVPLLDDKVTARSRPMGFWVYPEAGIGTPSHAWMTELLAAQKEGKEPADKAKLRLDAGKIAKRYAADKLAGHSAWIDGDWKLHRIPDKTGDKVRFELYNLAKDRAETTDVAAADPERVKTMKAALDAWQRSVIRSLNGEDY